MPKSFLQGAEYLSGGLLNSVKTSQTMAELLRLTDFQYGGFDLEL